MTKPLIVGESNPYGPSPEFALYPSPPGCAGWRLCHKVLGLDPDDYLERFDRTNLMANVPLRSWGRVSRQAAADLMEKYKETHDFILLGSKVTTAFGFTTIMIPSLADHSDWEHDHSRYFLIPHPSGRCRAWQDPTMVPRVRELLREFLP